MVIWAPPSPGTTGRTLAVPDLRLLSFHAAYRCRESGACCTSGWPIPIEGDRLTALEQAMAREDLPAVAPITFLRPVGAPAETPAILATNDGACVFHRRRDSARCDLHRHLGHTALPLACQQFPRVTVMDPRGVSVTLSHYCPTAAGMLDQDEPARIIRMMGAAAPNSGAGLDARDALPPLLRPGMLMDWESWSQWEESAVAVIENAPDTRTALADLRVVVERARLWTPPEGSLAVWLESAFRSVGGRSDQAGPPAPLTPAEHLTEVLSAVPEDWRPTIASLQGESPNPRARRRFLIAHCFANWTGHLGHGLRTWLRSIESADGLIAAGLGVRQADLLLRHLAEPHALVARWQRAERA